jgi:soluble lytic murein transglycosylase
MSKPALLRRLALLGTVLLGFACPPTPGDASEAHGISTAEARLATKIFSDIDDDRWTAARKLSAGVHDPVLAKLVQWLDLLRPQSGHSFAEIARFIDDNPDWPRQKALLLRAEDVIEGVPDAELKQWFAHHDPISPLAQLRSADLLAVSGKTVEARKRIEDAWINGNLTDEDFRKVLGRYRNYLTPDDHLRRADRLLWAGEIVQASRMLPLLPADWRALAEARMKLATSAPGVAGALAKVPAALQSNPGLLFERMRWHLARDDKDEAIALMESAHDDLGQPDRWWPCRQSLARELVNRGEAARAFGLAAANGLTSGPDATEAEFLTGWIALRFMNRPDLAYPHFIKLHQLAQRPQSIARAAYWAARAADGNGDKAGAKTWFGVAARYSTTFYGQLAAAQPGISETEHPEPEATTAPAETARFESQEMVRAILVLNAAGEDDLVKTFFVTLANRATSLRNYVLLAELAERIGRPDLGVTIAKIASYANVSMLRAGYPLTRVPRNAGAEQALLLAITRQESAFDTRAVSPTGARGLMQLEPATAAQIARKLGLPFKVRKLTDNGFFNVTLGQAYMDDLISRFDGSYVLAIAAYNAGPSRVSQWIGQFGDPRHTDVDTVDWIEKIPFNETRNYVQRVLENLQVYRLRIGKHDLAFSLPEDLHR